MNLEQQQSKYNDEHEKATKYETKMGMMEEQLERAEQRSLLRDQRLVRT